MEKLSAHGNGIALIFARTDNKWFQEFVFGAADGILFLKGRITFLDVEGEEYKYNAGAPSCLIAYGQDNLKALTDSGLNGSIVHLKPHLEGVGGQMKKGGAE